MSIKELLVAVLALFMWYVIVSTWRRNARLPFPPGPKPSLLLGNIHQLPRKKAWLTFTSWSKIYGPIFYFRVLDKRTVVLNSGKVALDLLERRSVIYSDRPPNWMAGELAGRVKSVFMAPTSGSRFRPYRKMLHAGLNTRASHSYQPIQLEERTTLLKNLATNPDEFINHVRRNAAAIIMKVAYGYQVNSNDDAFIGIIEDGAKAIEALMTPGKFWVEFLPFLRYFPSWFPGAGFKRLAIDARVPLSRIESEPFQWAQKNIATGDFIESFTSKLLLPENGTHPDAQEADMIKWVGGGLYVGGAETTVSVLTSFFYLMILHPEVQKRAQQEIDQVAGGRLPTFDDYKSMPYIRAVIREVIRWGPVAPLALPHRLVKDDVYDGYWIPKGSIIIANIWAMTHDEEVYPDSSRFDPSRHIGDHPQTDPFKYVFGFGRRVCPGAHLADMSLFLNIAGILAVFDIMKPLDEFGFENEPDAEFESRAGIIHLKRYSCRVIPRSKDALQMIHF